MSAREYGAPQVYEVTWQTGHVEMVLAHQVLHKSSKTRFGVLADGTAASIEEQSRMVFHAEVDGVWTLQLSALEADLRTVRNVTAGERTPGGTS